MKSFLALLFMGISTAYAQSNLPPHTVFERIDTDPNDIRVKIESNDQNLTKEQCASLIDFYAVDKGFIDVYKPSTNWLNSQKRQFCLNNFEGEGTRFRDYRLPRVAVNSSSGSGFYGAAYRGITAANTDGVVVTIYNRSIPPLERSPGWEDAAFVEDMVEDGVDVIVITGGNMRRILPVVTEAIERGVKFVCYSECERHPEIKNLGQVMIETDQWKFGFDMGEAVKEYARQRGSNSKIGILTCDKSPICSERKDGFVSAIEGSRNIVVAEEVSNNDNPEFAEKLLRENPAVDILWADYAHNTLAAVSAVEQLGRSGETVVFGSNATVEILRLLQENTILKAVAFQEPYEMGEKVLSTALQIATNVPQGSSMIHHPHIILDHDHPYVSGLLNQVVERLP